MASSGNGKKQKGRRLDVAALESWLWEAACTIRGPLDAPKFKDYILPLVFLKRLSDVFDGEIGHLAQEFGHPKTAAKLVEQDHKLVRFYLPPKARWSPSWYVAADVEAEMLPLYEAVVRLQEAEEERAETATGRRSGPIGDLRAWGTQLR